MKLSLVIPCFNEENTLRTCVERVLRLKSDELEMEILVVDDASTDSGFAIAESLSKEYPEVQVLRHERNQGKGAALRTGFARTTGDFVAVQDADLEYDPEDLLRLLKPLREGKADVVFGSRFLTSGEHRVLYFWHSLSNRVLTVLSNMLTDLNLTDMETCYKVFRGDVIRKIDIVENRFGFEPEITAKVAALRLRIYEMGISYDGRTYAQGKKIGLKDGLRALYCIIKYNMPKAPLPVQFAMYVFIGGLAALANLLLFLGLRGLEVSLWPATLAAFFSAAALNYWLSTRLLFRSGAMYKKPLEIAAYTALICGVAVFDVGSTSFLIISGASEGFAKVMASAGGLLLNFIGRKYLVFYERPLPDWER